MKKHLTLILFFVGALLFSQQKIAGVYHMSSGNPDDGGYNWYFTEDHKFLMITFGYAMAGTWKNEGKGRLYLTPIAPDQAFEVYGRFNPELKDTKVMFSNPDINEINYIGTVANKVHPLLSNDANCLPQPLIHHFNKTDKIILGCKNRMDEDEFFVSNLKQYNDIIVKYYSFSHRVEPFYALIKDNILMTQHSSRKSSPREEFSDSDLVEIKPIFSVINDIFPEYLLLNASYKSVDRLERFSEDETMEEFLQYNYDYNPETKSYTAKNKTDDPADAYHNMNILYRYDKIDLSPSKEVYEMDKESIINITCQNRY